MSAQSSFDYIISHNEASMGHLLNSGQLKIASSGIIKNNIVKLQNIAKALDKQCDTINSFQSKLYDESGIILLKPYKKASAQFNVNVLQDMRALNVKVRDVMKRCEDLLDKHKRVFHTTSTVGRTETGITVKNVALSKRKATKRRLARCLRKMQSVSNAILYKWMKLDINQIVGPNTCQYIHLINNVSNMNSQCIPLESVILDEVSKLNGFDMKALLLLVESKAFSHNATCRILESLSSNSENIYWNEYEKLYNQSAENEQENDHDSNSSDNE
jgi:hypothetical protein